MRSWSFGIKTVCCAVVGPRVCRVRGSTCGGLGGGRGVFFFFLLVIGRGASRVCTCAGKSFERPSQNFFYVAVEAHEVKG